MGIIIKELEVESERTEKLKVLFDTGASSSSLRKDAAEKIGYKREIPEEFKIVKTTLATGETIEEKLEGWAKIGIKINGCEIKEIIVPVRKNQLEEMIIGVDIMQSRKLIIDMAKEDINVSKCFTYPIG